MAEGALKGVPAAETPLGLQCLEPRELDNSVQNKQNLLQLNQCRAITWSPGLLALGYPPLASFLKVAQTSDGTQHPQQSFFRLWDFSNGVKNKREEEMRRQALAFCSGTFGSPLQARRRTLTKALLALASWVGQEEILLPVAAWHNYTVKTSAEWHFCLFNCHPAYLTYMQNTSCEMPG